LRKSRTGRLGGKRACLCKDGTYSRDCCDGGLWAQGIGNVTGEQVEEGASKYKVQHCSSSVQRNIHIHEGTLSISGVYYLRFHNSNYDGCYTVLSTIDSSGLHVNSATLYSDCTDCQTQNP